MQARVTSVTDRLDVRAHELGARIQGHTPLSRVDPFASLSAADVMHDLRSASADAPWTDSIRRSFLQAFTVHHPEYRQDACIVVSGSSRTGLGILGYHCGIRSVITPDLSWTYEHCFPSVKAVPLRPDLSLDTDGMIREVSQNGWRRILAGSRPAPSS